MKTENHDEHPNLYFWNPNVIKYKLLFFLIAESTDLPIGAIVGGCVGGLVFILIILMIYFICSRKPQNTNATATAVYENNTEVGTSGPFKEPNQTSAFNMEEFNSSEAKIDNIPPMTALHVNDIEVGTSGMHVVGKNKRMQAKIEQIRLEKQGKSDNTTPNILDPPPWVSGW
jgi:hypothetical protein